MKSVSALLLCFAPALVGHAQLTLSEFSHYTPSSYSPAFNGPWSEDTAESEADVFNIRRLGSNVPSGNFGNGFFQSSVTPLDLSLFNFVSLTGRTLTGNATPSLYFYLEDLFGTTALTEFTLGDLGGPTGTTVTQPLFTGAVDLTQVTYWGFVTQEFDAPEFAFSFDQVVLRETNGPLTPVPEPAYLGGMAAFALLVLGLDRWMRQPRAKRPGGVALQDSPPAGSVEESRPARVGV